MPGQGLITWYILGANRDLLEKAKSQEAALRIRSCFSSVQEILQNFN